MHSPRNWSEVKHYDLSGLEKCAEAGFQLILATNQPDLERQIIRLDFLKELHSFYQQKYKLNAVYLCPFASNTHPWKKPNPGMFLEAAQDLHFLDGLQKSFLLGDTERDTLAAKNCGMKSILWTREYNLNIASDFRIQSINELYSIITAF